MWPRNTSCSSTRNTSCSSTETLVVVGTMAHGLVAQTIVESLGRSQHSSTVTV